MKKLRFVLLIIVITVFYVGCVDSKNTETGSLDPSALSGTLPNGMHYIILENKNPSGKAELRLVVKSGSIQDLPKIEGTAHFVEHMQFQGTSRYKSQEIVQFFESIGMAFGPEVNAFTTYANTQYLLTIPSNIPSVFHQAIDILDDWAHGPVFDPFLIENERKIIYEEIHNYDTVQGRLQFAINEHLLENTPYAHNFPTGTKESVSAITAENLKEYVNRRYLTSLMTIVIIGDFHKEEIVPILMSTFTSDYGRSKTQVKEKKSKIKLQTVYKNSWFEYVDRDLPNDLYAWWNVENKIPFSLVDSKKRDACAEIALKAVNNRLSELSRDTDSGVLQASVLWVQNNENYREILRSLVPRNGAHEQAINFFLAELKRAREHGLTMTEYELGLQDIQNKSGVKLDQWMNASSGEKISATTLLLTDNVPYPYGEEGYNSYLLASKKIRKKDVDMWLRRYLFPYSAKIIACFKDSEGPAVLKEKQTQAIIKKYIKTHTKATVERVQKELVPLTPAPGTILSKESIPGTPFMKWTLSNGIKIYCYRNALTINDFRLKAFTSGGLSLVGDTEFWNGFYAMQILGNNGVGNLSLPELDDYLSGTKNKILFSLGLTRSEIYGESDSANHEELTKLFKLLYSHFTAPGRDIKMEKAEIERIQAWYSNNAETPEYRFQKEIADSLVGFDSRMVQPGLKGIPHLSGDAASALRSRFFSNPANLTFVICGDYLESRFENLVTTWIASIPTHDVTEIKAVIKAEDRGVRPIQGPYERILRAGKDSLAKTTLIMVTEEPWVSIHEQYASILGEMLRIRLREVLREKNAGTYGVGVSIESYKEPFSRTLIVVSFASEVSARLSLAEEAKKEMRRIAQGEVESRVFDSALEIHKERLASQIKSNEYWPEMITKALLNEVPLAELTGLREQAKAITNEEITLWARNVLQVEKMLTFVLEPENP